MDSNNLFINKKKLNRESFSLLFSTYYKDLLMFAGSYIPDKMTCEDMKVSTLRTMYYTQTFESIIRML